VRLLQVRVPLVQDYNNLCDWNSHILYYHLGNCFLEATTFFALYIASTLKYFFANFFRNFLHTINNIKEPKVGKICQKQIKSFVRHLLV
jgi:hypothetical protein